VGFFVFGLRDTGGTLRQNNPANEGQDQSGQRRNPTAFQAVADRVALRQKTRQETGYLPRYCPKARLKANQIQSNQ